jgi:hypothetical protein
MIAAMTRARNSKPAEALGLMIYRDIWIAANEMIALYGDDALDRVTDRIEQALVRDDEQMGTLMCEVYEAIEAWRREGRMQTRH